MEFKIHGKNQLYGDGFAMWLTKERAKPGPVFGSADNFEGLGIFFDTYKNNRPGVVFPFVDGYGGRREDILPIKTPMARAPSSRAARPGAFATRTFRPRPA